MLARIVSGGQTGVDRGALDAALALGFACGGWCPAGRRAEDGTIDTRYPLVELAGGYAARTRRNVADSDGTVIIHFGPLEGGTRLTRDICKEHAKPCLEIDGELSPPEPAASRIAAFVRQRQIRVLNVAGPRASKVPGARDYAECAIALLIGRIGGP